MAIRSGGVIWDLETVPDLRGFAAANDLVGKADASPSRRQLVGFRLPLISDCLRRFQPAQTGPIMTQHREDA
jgi:hypothetical protein